MTLWFWRPGLGGWRQKMPKFLWRHLWIISKFHPGHNTYFQNLFPVWKFACRAIWNIFFCDCCALRNIHFAWNGLAVCSEETFLGHLVTGSAYICWTWNQFKFFFNLRLIYFNVRVLQSRNSNLWVWIVKSYFRMYVWWLFVEKLCVSDYFL